MVTAVNSAGLESAASDEVSATPQAPVKVLEQDVLPPAEGLDGVVTPQAYSCATGTAVSSRISVSADDAEQRNDTGAMDLDGDTTNKWLQMYRLYGGDSSGALNWWGCDFFL